MFHKNLGMDGSKMLSGYSMVEHDALGCGRVGEATSGTYVTGRGFWSSPKLARSNEHAMADIAMFLGFDVRVGKMDINIEVSMSVWLVNSADVIVSMHGAKLTKMVFLLAGVAMIQDSRQCPMVGCNG
jgi:hypothetical protein